MKIKKSKKKTWNRVRKRRKKTLHFHQSVSHHSLLLLLFVALGIGGWSGYTYLLGYLRHNPSCTLTKIEVHGIKLLSYNEICKKMKLPSGVNIFSLSVNKIERTLQTDSLIEKANVGRKWPDTLVVSVKEREPVCKFKSMDAEFFLDKTGTPIQCPQGIELSVPVVSGVLSAKTMLPVLANFVFRFKEVNAALLAEIRTIHLEGEMIWLELDSGHVIWGEMDTSSIPAKIRKLHLVRKEIEKRGLRAEYIDLRFKNVVVKPVVKSI